MIRSITESANPLTKGLDLADPSGIVRLLRQADAQIFAGWDVFPALLDEETLESLAKVSWRLSRCLLGDDSIVVIAGAGTSGRLAHLACLEFNRQLREQRMREVFRPLLAGGEAALIQAVEAAEDNVSAAAKDLKEEVDSLESARGMYIGISAGLSAPYVAAQLDFIGANARFESVMIGFNPLEMARASAIEGWDHTVLSVLERAMDSPRFTLLNPVLGPEAVTGSTRMKGGTATKILLETAFAMALSLVKLQGAGGVVSQLGEDNLLPLRAPILDHLQRYRATVEATYTSVPAIAELVRLAGSALRSGGRIHYLGRGIAGLIAILDAVECVPTFGSEPFDVRGYVHEGWELLGFNPAAMKARGRAYEIGHDYFESDVLPDIQKGDLVIGVCIQSIGDNTHRLLAEAAKAKATTAVLMAGTESMKRTGFPDGLRHRCFVELPSTGYTAGVHNEAELALKICLNCITTGAHTLAGKIYHNQMIDLKLSNSKLYERAAGLISQLVGISEDDAKAALHHAIFKEPQKDGAPADSVAMAVQRAAGRKKLVPMAILLASKLYNFEQAAAKLEAEPRVRRMIEEVVEG